jgi:hypothetical protein
MTILLETQLLIRGILELYIILKNFGWSLDYAFLHGENVHLAPTGKRVSPLGIPQACRT